MNFLESVSFIFSYDRVGLDKKKNVRVYLKELFLADPSLDLSKDKIINLSYYTIKLLHIMKLKLQVTRLEKENTY